MQNTKVKLPSGAILNGHGQMFVNPTNGAKKKTQVEFAPAHGMKRATTGDLHPYLHGQSINDEAMQKTYERGVPLHPATPNRSDNWIFDQRGALTEGEAKAVLEDASKGYRK